MRTFAMLGFFVLAVVGIVEGVVIARLSGRIDALTRHQATAGSLPAPSAAEPPLGRATGVALARSAGATLPRLLPAAGDATPSTPAPAVLGEALATTEGRGHLKAALEILREQDKQERLVGRAERADGRDQERVQRMTKILSLSSEDQAKVGQLYTTLQTNRRHVLDDMHAGQKDSEQADDEIDKLRDQTDTALHTLLGEPRMRQYRESMQAQRRRGGGGGGGGNAGGGSATPTGAATGTTAGTTTGSTTAPAP